MMKSWAKQLSMPSLNLSNSGTEFQFFPVNSSTTSNLDELEIHISILQPGNSPHTPHSHFEEELIIPLSGKIQIIRLMENKKILRSKPLSIGSFTYHHSMNSHTIYSVGPEPAIYICIKWNGNRFPEKKALYSYDFTFDYTETQKLESKFETKILLESPTQFLEKLHCHTSQMKPGAGYKPHMDPYDVLIILLKGKIKTLQKELKSKSIIFYNAEEPHGLKNIGSDIAQYIVFEFHGKNLQTIQNKIKKILKNLMKRFLPKKIRSFLNFLYFHKY